MQNMTITFSIIILLGALAAFYSSMHIARQLRFSWKTTLITASVLGLLAACHQLFLSLGFFHEIIGAPFIFYPLIFATNFGILAIPCVLVTDIILAIIRLIKGPVLTDASFVKWRKKLGALYALAFALLSITSTYNAVKDPIVTPIDIYTKDLPADLEGFKIAQISDVHTSPFFGKERSNAIVKATMEQHPDLIAITGDQSDGIPSLRENALAPFFNLKAAYGVWYIPGNHEYITDFKPWITWYKEKGLNLMLNTHSTFKINNSAFTVIGLDDESASRLSAEPQFKGPDLQKALPENIDDDFRLLLAHQPRAARQYADAEYGIDLMLSGHTHGGQVPLLSTLTALANNGFVKGLYKVNDMQLYVCLGAGLWQGFCARLNTFPEIALFTLHKAPN